MCKFSITLKFLIERFFSISKKEKLEIENFVTRLKIMHSDNFRKSLNIPTKTMAFA